MDGMEQMVDDGYLDCPVCGGPCPAEIPECRDGHGPGRGHDEEEVEHVRRVHQLPCLLGR